MDDRHLTSGFAPGAYGQPQPGPLSRPTGGSAPQGYPAAGFPAAGFPAAGFPSPGTVQAPVPSPGTDPAGYAMTGAAQAGFPAAGYPQGLGLPGDPTAGFPGYPPGMYPPGYNPWIGAFAGPRYASVWARIAAYVIDSLVLGVVNVVAYLTVIVMTTTTGPTGSPTVPTTAILAALVLILVLDGIYFVAQEGSSGQTIGKRVLGIRVVKADGGEMGADAALVRYLFLLLAGLGFGGLVTLLMISLSDTKQRLGDRVAGTIVVRAG